MAYQETSPNLQNVLKDLERRVRKLESSSRLTSASIDSGGLTVQGGGEIRILGPTGDVLVTLDAAGLTAAGGTISGSDISGATVEGGVFRTDISPNNRVEITKTGSPFGNGEIHFYDNGSAGGSPNGGGRIYASPDALNIEFGTGFPHIVLQRDGQVLVNGVAVGG